MHEGEELLLAVWQVPDEGSVGAKAIGEDDGGRWIEDARLFDCDLLPATMLLAGFGAHGLLCRARL